MGSGSVGSQARSLRSYTHPPCCHGTPRFNIGIVWSFFGGFVLCTWLVLTFRRYERR
jgi:hypothetical protein